VIKFILRRKKNFQKTAAKCKSFCGRFFEQKQDVPHRIPRGAL
jgi:hypothetical protein